MTRTRKFTVILTAIAAIVLIVAAILNATVISPWLEEKRAQKEHARRVEEYRAAKREIFAEENAERQDYDIAFIGDSITDLYNVKEFFPDLVVTNRGIGGDTTYDLEGRLEISLFEIKPRVVVMLIGTNNLDSMFENYERIILSILERLPDTKLVICEMPPTRGMWKEWNQKIVKGNVKVRELADKYDLTCVDYFTPLYDTVNCEFDKRYTDDDLHPNHAGYEVITEVLSPIVYNLLGKE